MYPRIRDLREDKDMNQTQVAKMLGMSQTGYSKYETGENDIPTVILIKLARYYNTSIDYLLGETDNSKRYEQILFVIKKKKPNETNVSLGFLVRVTGEVASAPSG